MLTVIAFAATLQTTPEPQATPEQILMVQRFSDLVELIGSCERVLPAQAVTSIKAFLTADNEQAQQLVRDAYENGLNSQAANTRTTDFCVSEIQRRANELSPRSQTPQTQQAD